MRRIGFVLAVLLATAPALAADAIPGWGMAGSAPKRYRAVVDTTNPHGGADAVRIWCTGGGDTGQFGTLMQVIDPAAYAGKRVRLSGWLRTEDVGDWASLWMRVDGADHEVLAFDNMQDRAVRGTTEWTRYDVVLDVAADAKALSFGVILSGTTGKLWVDDLSMEIVDDSVPVTGASSVPHARPTEPANLDFEGADAAK